MRLSVPILMLALSTGFGVTWAEAHEFTAASLVIEHPYARSTVAVQKNGAAYMVIRNEGSEPERLLTIRSSESQRAGLHSNTVSPDGVVQMRPVSAVDIPPGGTATLAPGGVHIMLEGLKKPLAEGTIVPMTLVFEHAGDVAIEIQVESLRAGKPGSDHHDTGASGMDHNAHRTAP